MTNADFNPEDEGKSYFADIAMDSIDDAISKSETDVYAFEVPDAQGIRQAVIWSEILNRKY